MSLGNMFLFRGYLPEKVSLGKTKKGTTVAEFRLPTSSSRKDADGKYVTDWHNMTAYGITADLIGKYNKGDLIMCLGEVQEQSWTDDRGFKRYKTVFLVNQVERVSKAKAEDDFTEQYRTVPPMTEELPF